MNISSSPDCCPGARPHATQVGAAVTKGSGRSARPAVGCPRDEDDGRLAFLGCLQLADSLFPTGLYTLSYGLESFAAETSVDPLTLEALLIDHLRHGVAPTDGIALAIAHRAATTDDLEMAERADTRLSAVKLPREQREAATRVGRALLNVSSKLFGNPHLPAYLARVRQGATPGNQAVALGLVLAGLGVPVEHAVATELYTMAAGFGAAAVRLGVTDHLVAQTMLHRVKPLIAEEAAAAPGRDIGEIGGCTPMIDIMAMRHERADVRLFTT
ncbi:urease accessory protein UreF [Streptomyces sp. NPDC052043]|uniref:urease accessory protein UreF n=1 Tax=Streptomyces sp. NPDC052043 TaxID=3365684 RepID=UPI0037CF53BD